MSDRVTGIVKFYDKGYGFIKPETGGKDIFVHRSGLADGLEKLSENQKVTYLVVDSDRKIGDGKKAIDVQVMA